MSGVVYTTLLQIPRTHLSKMEKRVFLVPYSAKIAKKYGNLKEAGKKKVYLLLLHRLSCGYPTCLRSGGFPRL